MLQIILLSEIPLALKYTYIENFPEILFMFRLPLMIQNCSMTGFSYQAWFKLHQMNIMYYATFKGLFQD